MIVRWSLAELPELLSEVRIGRPFLIASPRWESLELPEHVERWTEVPSHRVEVPDEADGILAVGGGSAIDTAKLPPRNRRSRSCTCRRRTRAPSGQPVTASLARPRDPGRRWRCTARGDRLRRRPDARPPEGRDCGTASTASPTAPKRSTCKPQLRGRRQALAGSSVDRVRCRVIADPGDRAAREELLRGAAHGSTRWACPGWRSRVRWRKRWAERTACRTAR
jgi:hypothetical protein